MQFFYVRSYLKQSHLDNDDCLVSDDWLVSAVFFQPTHVTMNVALVRPSEIDAIAWTALAAQEESPGTTEQGGR